jgi:uncharacterized protein (DUF58 family)
MSSGYFQFLGFIGGFILLGAVPFIYVTWHFTDRKVGTKEWTVLTSILLAASILVQLTVLSLLTGLVLIAIGIAWLWHRIVLSDVYFERHIDADHLFPGEESTITWTIRNEKPFPVSWLHWQETTPTQPFGIGWGDPGLEFADIEIKRLFTGSSMGIDEVTSVSAFQTLIKSTKFKALRRGFYQFGPTYWEASDPLGLFMASREFPVRLGLAVYPRLYTPADLEIPTESLTGEMRRRSFIEDPSWYRGSRDYRSSDPLRTIDWKLTARTRELQVKMFEPTVHPKIMVFANLHAFERISEGLITQYMEEVISTAASIAKWALEMDHEVGVHSNGALPGRQEAERILPSAGLDQLFFMLDYFARLSLVMSRRMEDMLEPVLEELPYGTSLIVCSNVVTSSMMEFLSDAGKRRSVVLVLVDTNTVLKIPNVTVIHARAHRQAAA